MKKIPLIDLLGLLGSNQDKLKAIQETNSSDELFNLYKSLPNGKEQNDQTSDFTNITDAHLKKEILNKPLTLRALWNIYKKEHNLELKTFSIDKYIRNYPVLFCPNLMKVNLLASKDINKSLLLFQVISWQVFLITIGTSVFTHTYWPSLIIFSALSFFWYGTKGLSDKSLIHKIQETTFLSILFTFSPVLIPLFIGSLISFMGMELIWDKIKLKFSFPKDEDEDDKEPGEYAYSLTWNQ